MLVKDKYVVITLSNNNMRNRYKDLGYKVEPNQSELKVKTQHLQTSSTVVIDFYCDDCGEIYQKQRRSHGNNKRDLCKECRANQAKENFKEETIKIYGKTEFECHKKVMRKHKQGYKRCIPIQRADGVLDKYSGQFETFYYTIMKLAEGVENNG